MCAGSAEPFKRGARLALPKAERLDQFSTWAKMDHIPPCVWGLSCGVNGELRFLLTFPVCAGSFGVPSESLRELQHSPVCGVYLCPFFAQFYGTGIHANKRKTPVTCCYCAVLSIPATLLRSCSITRTSFQTLWFRPPVFPCFCPVSRRSRI